MLRGMEISDAAKRTLSGLRLHDAKYVMLDAALSSECRLDVGNRYELTSRLHGVREFDDVSIGWLMRFCVEGRSVSRLDTDCDELIEAAQRIG